MDVPRFDYDDHRHQNTWKSYGETAYMPKDMKPMADAYLEGPSLFPILSMVTEKHTKLMIWLTEPDVSNYCWPSWCRMQHPRKHGYEASLFCSEPMFERQLVISLPKIAKSNDWDDDELAFKHLRKKINARPELVNRGISFAKILTYSTKVAIMGKIENKGVATVQNHMIEREK